MAHAPVNQRDSLLHDGGENRGCWRLGWPLEIASARGRRGDGGRTNIFPWRVNEKVPGCRTGLRDDSPNPRFFPAYEDGSEERPAPTDSVVTIGSYSGSLNG